MMNKIDTTENFARGPSVIYQALLTFSLLFLLSFQAHAGKAFAMIELGATNISISSDLAFDEQDGDEDLYALNLWGGYRWSSKFVIAGGASIAEDGFIFGALDSYKLTEVYALLGYTIELGKHFHLLPMLGLSSWQLEAQEGQLFNPGPEETRELDGTDLTWRLNIEIPFNQRVRLNLAYGRPKYDFGYVESVRVGVKVQF